MFPQKEKRLCGIRTGLYAGEGNRPIKREVEKVENPMEQEFCVNVRSRGHLIMTSWPTVPSRFGRNLRDP